MPDAKPLVFADLDDTLFQSRRKMAEVDIARPAAVAGNGDPRKASFMTARQSALFDWLNATTELIPVTARSGDAFSRVDLPFKSWAIISNGAVILQPDGRPYKAWQDQMRTSLNEQAETMQLILNHGRAAAKSAGINVRSWVVEEDGLATYVVFKLNDVSAESQHLLQDLSMPVGDWTRHYNSETLAMIPPGSGKAAAMAHLQKHLDPQRQRPSLGFGDSTTDLSYMKMTDVLMIPCDSQITKAL